jgi:hypothetical protein
MKSWIRIIEKKIQREDQEKREKVIVENIEKRFGMIGRMEKQMLNSILERPWKKLLIEKVLVGEESITESRELITDPEEVLKEVDSHFQRQFYHRDHKFESMSEEWKEEYSPKPWIEENWYKEVMAEVELEE